MSRGSGVGLGGVLNVLLVAAIVLPIAGVALDRMVRPASGDGWVSARAATLSFLMSMALLVTAIGDEPAASVSLGWQPLGGFAADRTGVLLLALVLGVSAVSQTFAVRYLYGEPSARRFFLGAALLTSSTAGVVTATTLLGLAVCWSFAGLGLCTALSTYGDLPAARLGMRRTAGAFVIGDLALWGAVIAGSIGWGTVSLRERLARDARRSDAGLGAAACGCRQRGRRAAGA